MGWKNFPYWLRGGIIGFIIYTVLWLTTTTFRKLFYLPSFSLEVWLENFQFFISWYLLIAIPFLAISIIIGIIYGAIKYRGR